MRPIWERSLTRGVASHLYLQGLSTDHAYAVAALIVRALDRRYGFLLDLSRYPLVSLIDVDDPEKTSPRFLALMRSFWKVVGGAGERNRLLDLARSSLLQSSRAEIDSAAVLAQETKLLESEYGALGDPWVATGWAGFRGLAAEFGVLRDEMAATGSAGVLAAYDRLVADSASRKAVVKMFQTWTKNLDWYTGRIDGIWGDKTEAAFVQAVPYAVGKLSELRYSVAIRPAVEFNDAAAIAVLITRDLWLLAHPDKIIAAEPVAEPEIPGDPSSISVTYPKIDSATATPAAGGGSQVVVTYPKVDGAGAAERVAITLPSADEITASIVPVSSGWRPSKELLVGGGLVLAGIAIIGTAVVWQHRNARATATEAEAT